MGQRRRLRRSPASHPSALTHQSAVEGGGRRCRPVLSTHTELPARTVRNERAETARAEGIVPQQPGSKQFECSPDRRSAGSIDDPEVGIEILQLQSVGSRMARPLSVAQNLYDLLSPATRAAPEEQRPARVQRVLVGAFRQRVLRTKRDVDEPRGPGRSCRWVAIRAVAVTAWRTRTCVADRGTRWSLLRSAWRAASALVVATAAGLAGASGSPPPVHPAVAASSSSAANKSRVLRASMTVPPLKTYARKCRRGSATCPQQPR